jgi:hypothetical protein
MHECGGWTDFPRRKHTIHELVRQAVWLYGYPDKLGRFSDQTTRYPAILKNLPNLFHDPGAKNPFLLTILIIDSIYRRSNNEKDKRKSHVGGPWR